MKRVLVLLLVTFPFSALAFDFVIEHVKDKKFLSSGELPLPKKGDTVFLTDDRGNLTGRATITASKGRKIVGIMIEGDAHVGLHLVPQATPPPVPTKFWGIGLFAGANHVKAKLSSGNEIDLEGNGPGAELLFDWDALERLRLRFFLSYIPLVANGTLTTTACEGSVDCVIKLNYFSTRIHGQYLFGSSIFKGLIGGGVGLHFPTSKSSNFLDTEKLSYTQTFEAEIGMEFRFQRNTRLDVGLQTLIFPSSASVQVQQSGAFVQLLRSW